tara:strand:+ start:62 stop:592 length:531 start_codon:yes stop_codon:yes gene_type:complete
MATISTGILESALETNKSFLQPTGFKININRKYFPNLEFFAQSILHPAVSVTAVEVPVPRVSGIPMPGDTINYGEVSAMIILDEQLSGYTELLSWLESFVQTKYVAPTDGGSATKGPSSADLTISILSSHNNVIKQIVYKDAIPTNLGDIQFEAASGDVNYVIYPATFRFSYFEIK